MCLVFCRAGVSLPSSLETWGTESEKERDAALSETGCISVLVNLVSEPPRVREPAPISVPGLGAGQAGGHPWSPGKKVNRGQCQGD